MTRQAPDVLLPLDVAALKCQFRSGAGLDDEDTERLFATIESLQRIVRDQAERVEDVSPGGRP